MVNLLKQCKYSVSCLIITKTCFKLNCSKLLRSLKQLFVTTCHSKEVIANSKKYRFWEILHSFKVNLLILYLGICKDLNILLYNSHNFSGKGSWLSHIQNTRRWNYSGLASRRDSIYLLSFYVLISFPSLTIFSLEAEISYCILCEVCFFLVQSQYLLI